MSAPVVNPSDEARRGALDFIWEQYRIWDNTSVQLRRQLTFWRRLVLILGIAGALAATLSTQPFVTQLGADGQPPAGRAAWLGYIPSGLGILSAILLGFAAFASQKVLSPKDEEQWVGARAAAEAFKREAFLLVAQAPPYDVAVSIAPAEAINNSLDRLEPLPLDRTRAGEAPPAYPLTVDGYISSRLEEQMNWYERRAGDHRKTLKLISGATLGLGGLAVVLGVVSTDMTAPWVAVITTMIATLTAYLYAWRYQYMVVSYLATARKLSALRARWRTSGKSDADTADRNQFILECEGILSAENKAWMTELNRRDATGSAPVASQPAQVTGGGKPAAGVKVT
jgi:membrane protein implicated in regulation of membrane protease activity